MRPIGGEDNGVCGLVQLNSGIAPGEIGSRVVGSQVDAGGLWCLAACIKSDLKVLPVADVIVDEF